MNVSKVFQRAIIFIALTIVGDNVFAAACTTACGKITGKITDVSLDTAALYTLGASTAESPVSTSALPWVLVSIDTSLGGGTSGTIPGACLVSGTTYRVGVNYTTTTAMSWNPLQSALLTAKTASNLTAIFIENGTGVTACVIKAVQVLP